MIGVDNLITGRMDNIAHLDRDPRFEFIEADISEPFDPGAVDVVFNFASPASPPAYLAAGIETLRAGSYGMYNVLELARKYSARILQASTSECYGDPLENPQRESYWGHVNPIGPRSVYDESKRFAEAMTMAYRRYHKLDTRIVRIFNTYGPRLCPTDGRVISNFMCQALSGDDITIYGSGKQTRSFCYVSDEIDGILRLSRSDEAEPVNIGNPDEFTILDCAELVLEITGAKSKLRFEPAVTDDPQQRRPDITKARTILGWEPTVPLAEGLRRSVDYFRAYISRATAEDGAYAV